MAVMKMMRIRLCAMKRDRKQILELLQRREVVEIRSAGKEGKIFQKTDMASFRDRFEKNARIASDALDILRKHEEEKGSKLAFLRMQSPVSVQENAAFYDRIERVVNQAQRVIRLERGMAEAKAEILRIDMRQASLAPWMDLPVPQRFSGTKKTTVLIGLLEGEHTLNGIMERFASAAPGLDAVHIEIVSKRKEQTCIYVIILKKDAEQAEAALRAIGFTRPAAMTGHMPTQKQHMLMDERAQAQQRIEQAGQELSTLVAMRDDFRYLQDHMTMRAEKYAVIEQLLQSRHAFVLQGYIPVENAEALKHELTEKFDCSVEMLSTEKDRKAPVKLRNSRFSEPTEIVLESYSMPGKGELDPTGVMSIFYYLMFGLMFSDAGYGLILALVCGILLLKVKNMKPNWNRNLRLFFWCGVSTMFWGVIFSSYFGDVVDVVASTFFNTQASIPPLWFYPMASPMRLLMFCLAIGIVHLLAGYVMKGLTCIKNGDHIDFIYETVFPVGILLPLVVILMGSDMFYGMAGFMIQLSPLVSDICLLIAGICALGVLLTGGRDSKNWGKRILKGLYGLYNVLAGWLSDILSYSRLLALGLATGVIASVMNQLGAMFGGGFIGLVGFLIVFLIGHALNFGINVLGAYVHSNRLAYVEFFGKFYEGGGRKYMPFGMNTKYYVVKEETQNV
ncbi:MAG: V-type ATP synthase subunit I [Christensenellales bacterium]|jgi:V/A-type H+-transporting ATPase subunit I